MTTEQTDNLIAQIDALRIECAEMHERIADYQSKRARPAARYQTKFLPDTMDWEQHRKRVQELRAEVTDATAQKRYNEFVAFCENNHQLIEDWAIGQERRQ
jgi:uncharacterized coiled-coil DUF342 family protein